jgi:Rieske Fe-S protein
VLVGVCTYCRCKLRSIDDDALGGPPGGYFCDCCASHYDPAGRTFSGIARYNLAVPPYEMAQDAVRIGKNPPGAVFFFESIEHGPANG